ncbi:hypothetical protein DPMN_097045 [Dreissena polymorpha]|uniref:Uncharacterized protein n=1 Tax=Dreissena polymorpha TaxID=45954 RepID=A0A9D4LC85_DREPO|nr:hypothetical protein DPMN_097045 [Dreissena polymorpha]
MDGSSGGGSVEEGSGLGYRCRPNFEEKWKCHRKAVLSTVNVLGKLFGSTACDV